jgi:cytochrome c-type biogenesis protein
VGILTAAAVGAADPGTVAAGLSFGSLAFAGLAGLLAFLSPCCLPLIPGYVSFVSGLSRDELTTGTDRRAIRTKSLLGAIAFVAGFSAVFTLLGATATALGSLMMEYLPMMTKVAGGFVVLFGLHTTGLLKIPILYREARFHAAPGTGLLAAFAMGLAFAFGWTPCIGPILAGILGLAAAQDTVWQGVASLMTFSLGLGIPFIITALSVNTFLSFFAKYKRYIGWGEKAAGAFLILLGVLIFTNRMTDLLRWMPDFLQSFAL